VEKMKKKLAKLEKQLQEEEGRQGFLEGLEAPAPAASCPICLEEFGSQLGLTPCGHFFCMPWYVYALQ
jgi:hypothetical protein